MHRILKTSIIAGLLFILSIHCFATMDVILDTMYSVGKKYNVMLTPYKPMTGSIRSNDLDNLWSVNKYDLEYTGYFSVMTVAALPTLPNSPSYVDLGFLKDLNVEYYTQGSYSVSGSRLGLYPDLINAQNGLREWGKRYQGDLVLTREMAHRFSDEIVNKVTSFKGIACSKIAFISKTSGNKELYTMDYDGYGATAITHDKSILLSPSWSPDTTEVAYVSFKDGNPAIYVINVFSKKSRKIAGFKGLNSSPTWSPDGKYIACTLTKDGDEDIYLIDPSGRGEPKRITFDRGIDTSPSWSPDGKQIAFVSNRVGGPQIYVMSVDGTNVRRLTNQGGYNTCPAWSPRGDLIAYASQNSEGFNIFVIQSDGQNPLKLTSGSGSNEEPSWSPDGRHIAFSSTRNGVSEIYTISFPDGNVNQITKSGMNCSQPSWSK